MKICPACAREYADALTHCHDDGVVLVRLATTSNERASDLLGKVVGGRYRLDRIVGRGGMGTVYAATHVVVGKEMAIKVLRSGIERSEEILQRFIREAKAANAVRSRHICEMSDFGQLSTGAFYVVMELLNGVSLTIALRERRLSQPQIRKVFIQISETLEKAHSANIVHRDLKPDNVVLVEDDGDPNFVKLVDFGIAKMMESKASDLTETGVILGTPYYMSPEQARGDSVDHRSDIYAMGVMMYRAFTGKLPFVADTAMGVLTRHLTQKPELPSRVVADIDPSVESIILRCLEKKPEDRFQRMAQVAEALRQVSIAEAAKNQHPTLDDRNPARAVGANALALAVQAQPVDSDWTGTTSVAARSETTTPHVRSHVRSTSTQTTAVQLTPGGPPISSSPSGVPSGPPSLAFPPMMPLPVAPASQTGLNQMVVTRAAAERASWEQQAPAQALPLLTPVSGARDRPPPEHAATATPGHPPGQPPTGPSGQAPANAVSYQPEAYTNRGVVSTRLEIPQPPPTPRTGMWVAIGGGLLLAMLVAGVLAAVGGDRSSGPAAGPAPAYTAPTSPDDDAPEDDAAAEDDDDAASPSATAQAARVVPPTPQRSYRAPQPKTPSPESSSSASPTTTAKTTPTAQTPAPQPRATSPAPAPVTPTAKPTSTTFQDIRSPFD